MVVVGRWRHEAVSNGWDPSQQIQGLKCPSQPNPNKNYIETCSVKLPNKVAATLTNEKAACGPDLRRGEEAEPGKASHQRIQPTVATQTSPFTVIDVDDSSISGNSKHIHSCMCTAEKESNSAIFQRDDYIRPTDKQNENREMSTNLPKIIVVQPRYDPS